MTEPAFLLVMIGALSLVCQLLAVKLRIPAILFLLLAGIVFGPVLNILDSDALLGDLLFPFVSLSVAIILFEGALTLNFKELGKHGPVVFKLCSYGVLISWLVVAPVTKYALDISWSLAFLFSAIMTVTGPTVIMPLLKAVRPNEAISKVLRWEGVIIDPIGAILAVLVFEFIIIAQDPVTGTLTTFLLTLLSGALMGGLFGLLVSQALMRDMVPRFLINFFVLIAVLTSFQAANQLAHESGLIAVTVLGIWLANVKGVNVDIIKEFKETLTVLLISGLFILLAARVNLQSLTEVAPSALIIVAAMFLLARPLAVIISTWGVDMSWQEKTLINWLAPRGIVAAAISALFVYKLTEQGNAEAQIILPAVFFVIITTVLLLSLSAKPLAFWLGVRESNSSGFLIFGANPFTRALAKEMAKNKRHVVLADTNREGISQARMQGITTYLGDPSSAHAQLTLEASKIGRVLVLSPYQTANSILTHYYQDEFGRHNVFGLAIEKEEKHTSHLLHKPYKDSLGVFGGHTFAQFNDWMAQGAVLKSTQINDEYSKEQYFEDNRDKVIPLLAIDKEGNTIVISQHDDLQSLSAGKIISLVLPKE